MLEDKALLARARRLDADALAEIHDQYYPAIFRFIAFRIGDPQAAEDLTSDVFTRLLVALRSRGEPTRSLRAWLYRVAANVVADAYRKGYPAMEVELSEAIPAVESSPAEAVDTRLTNEQLRAAVRGLTGDQQIVIDLRFGQGYSIQETAEAMGKQLGAVKQLQARALAALARRLNSADRHH